MSSRDQLVRWQGKVIVGSILAISFWSVLDASALSSFTVYAGFNILVTFISTTAAVIVILRHIKDSSYDSTFLIPALLFSSAIYLGKAIDSLIHSSAPPFVKLLSTVVGDTFELFLLGVLFLLSVRYKNVRNTMSLNRTRQVVLLITVGLLIIYWIFQNILITQWSATILIGVGVLVGTTTVILFMVTAYLSFNKWSQKQEHDHILPSFVFLLFAISSIFITISSLVNSALWIFAFILQGAGLLIIMVSVTISYLHDQGVSYRGSRFFIRGILFLIFSPFVITLLAEIFWPLYYSENIGAYAFAHLSAACLAFVLAYLVYRSTIGEISWGRYPLIVLFISWALADLASIFIFTYLKNGLVSESLIPFIVSSMTSFLALYFSVRWTSNPPEYLQRTGRLKWIVFSSVLTGSIIAFGEVTLTWFLTGTPEQRIRAVGNVWLLVITLMTLIVFIVALVKHYSRDGGKMNIDVATCSFVAIWIFPNILKGTFPVWTAGWWIGEIFRIIGLVLCLGLLGVLYLNTLAKTRELQTQTVLFRDILAHDITNYLQVIYASIELAEMKEEFLTEGNLDLELAKENIERASTLIKNVNVIGRIESSITQTLEPVDIVECIRRSYDQVCNALSESDCIFNIDRNAGECFTRANILLDDIFLNLIRNAILYSKVEKRIDVQISLADTFWEIRISDHGGGIEPSRKANLFKRYSKDASGSGLGLSVVKSLVEIFGGSVKFEERVSGDYSLGTVFVLLLPVESSTVSNKE